MADTWTPNDAFPLPLSQEFEAPAAAWADHDWFLGLGMVQAAEEYVGGTFQTAWAMGSNVVIQTRNIV